MEAADAAKDNILPTKAELKKEKLRAWKNVFVLQIVVFLYMSPMMTYSNVMSSLNGEDGMGLASESINGGFLLFGSLLFCCYVTRRWSARFSIRISLIVAIPYLLINYYVVWPTIIFGSIMVGIGDCLIHQAIGVYVSDISNFYSKKFGNERESFLMRLFGLVGWGIQGSFITGNLLVWGILDVQHLRTSNETLLNATSDAAGDHYGATRFCGPSFCHNLQPLLTKQPDQSRVYILCSIFTAMGVLGAVIALCFMDDYSTPVADKPEFSAVLKGTMRMCCEPAQPMLMVLSVLIGIYEGFFFGDFTEAYVSCSLSISQVGLVMIAFGVSHAVSSIMQETLDAWFGRIVVVLFGGSLLFGLVVSLMYWQPQPDQLLMFYGLAALWGVADAVLAIHVSTLFGTIFENKPEEAYSWQTFSYGLGLCVSFGYSYYLCVRTKLFILMTAVVIAMISYSCLESYLRHKRKSNEKPPDDKKLPVDTYALGRTASVSVSQAQLLQETT